MTGLTGREMKVGAAVFLTGLQVRWHVNTITKSDSKPPEPSTYQ
jgi:hypothetical protein